MPDTSVPPTPIASVPSTPLPPGTPAIHGTPIISTPLFNRGAAGGDDSKTEPPPSTGGKNRAVVVSEEQNTENEKWATPELMGTLLVALSAMLFAGNCVCLRAMRNQISGPAVAVVRCVCITVVCAVARLCNPGRRLGEEREALSNPYVHSWGILNAVAMCLSFEVMEKLEPGISMSLLGLQPIFAALFGWWFLSNRLSVPVLVAVPLSVIGVIMVSRPWADTSKGGTNLPLWYSLGVLKAVVSGGAWVVLHKADHVSVLLLTISTGIYGGLLNCVVIAPVMNSAFLHVEEVAALLALCVGISMIALITKTEGGKHASPALASCARVTDVGWAFWLEIIVFNTEPKTIAWVGSAVITFAVLLMAIPRPPCHRCLRKIRRAITGHSGLPNNVSTTASNDPTAAQTAAASGSATQQVELVENNGEQPTVETGKRNPPGGLGSSATGRTLTTN